MNTAPDILTGTVESTPTASPPTAANVRYRVLVNFPGQSAPVLVENVTPANRGDTGDLLLSPARAGDPVFAMRVGGRMFLFILTETLAFGDCPE